MQGLTASDTWRQLTAHRDNLADISTASLFDAHSERSQDYGFSAAGLYFDYARQRLSDEIRKELCALAAERRVLPFLNDMASGALVNATEGRAALHTACRGTPSGLPEIDAAVAEVDRRMQDFVAAVHMGSVRSGADAPFTAVLAIGIGGSELGPALTVDALRDACPAKLDVRFCGNIDGIAFNRATQELDPTRTLVVVVSKSFTTLETTENAARAKVWIETALGDSWEESFCVVSANLSATAAFGIVDDRVFPMWDWVGGRFSLWSAVGLPVALAFGWDVFQGLRDGAHAMDTHALTAPAGDNMPVMMALLTLWNTDFLGYRAEVCVPYDSRLSLLVPHLQQLQMESNGKSATTDAADSEVPTQPVVFGGVGTNAQHAFFQQLHQGMIAAPVDFLIPADPPTGDVDLHESLTLNALAQADALAFGDPSADDPHKRYPGSRPSSIVMYPTIDPETLGKLIALYEHKTAALGALWGINPFDQWGVELGKSLSRDYAREGEGTATVSAFRAALKETAGEIS